MSPATWVRQGKPPHRRDTARGSPGGTAAAVPWVDAGRGCREGMETLASGVHPPQPGRTVPSECRHRRAELQRQRLHGSGRSAVTSRPRLRLQPVSSYSRSRAPCHRTTPRHATPRRPRRCRASREPGGTTEPAPAPPGCGSASQHIPFPAFSSAALHIHSQTPVSR